MKRRALISVSDKSGVVEFAKRLYEMGFEIISTGGTARALEEARVPVVPVSKVTDAPEMLGGRVKTLHPRIHGGILADLEDPNQVVELVDHDIGPIDLVCVNLYPFEETVAGGASEKEAVEQIDIGGPTMLRAAAKNFRSVVVVPSPSLYEEVASELELGEVSLETRRRLALDAFRRTAGYDAAIARWLTERTEGETTDGAAQDERFPEVLTRRYERELSLRYGENPHQEAAYYAESGEEHLLSGVERLQGRELSFNNLYDVDAARTVLAGLSEGSEPAVVIVKHANPCGAAVAWELAEAYSKAFASDPTSAFGGIVALSRAVSGELAAEISQVFTEVLIAPEFEVEAREIFSAKPNMILLKAGPLTRPDLSAKHVTGGLLLQQTDRVEDDSEYEIVTSRQPSPVELSDLLFAWKIAKSVKSNAIVLAKDGATVGIGAGQTSRVEAAHLAVRKAGKRAVGAVAASDAFFPFADGLESLTGAGVSAVIQPGGSKRDGEVIQAAEEWGIAMVMTKRRHFLH
jgi:phosphoribosylaminoimidazolecarboxamide formyltransferase / IMP cyclohydrolase